MLQNNRWTIEEKDRGARKKRRSRMCDRAAETSNTDTGTTGNELTNKEEQRVQIVEKPKRKVTRPAYLDD